MRKVKRPRGKRLIKRPLRYVTTSSDQSPTLKRKPRTNKITGEVDDDINELRHIFKENKKDEKDEEYEEDEEDEDDIEDEDIENEDIEDEDIEDEDIEDEDIEDEDIEDEDIEDEESKENEDNENHMSSHTHTFRDTHKNINLHQNAPRKTHSHIPFSASQNTSLKKSQNQAKVESRIKSQRLEPIDSYRKIQDRFDSVETQLKKMNTLLEHIFKRIQHQKGIPRKPSVLPISSCSEMDAFEKADDKIYFDVVTYFRHIGGFHLKEAINLCFKEGIKDAITSSFTWWGRNQNHRSLHNARLTMAIYEAVCNNEHFSKPTRTDFQRHIREALRTAKERQRHRINGRKRTDNSLREQNFWIDVHDVEETTEERLNEMCQAEPTTAPTSSTTSATRIHFEAM